MYDEWLVNPEENQTIFLLIYQYVQRGFNDDDLAQYCADWALYKAELRHNLPVTEEFPAFPNDQNHLVNYCKKVARNEALSERMGLPLDGIVGDPEGPVALGLVEVLRGEVTENVNNAIQDLEATYPGNNYATILELYYGEGLTDRQIANEIYANDANAQMQVVNNARNRALVLLRAKLLKLAIDERTAEIITQAIDLAECNINGLSCGMLLKKYYYEISSQREVFDKLQQEQQLAGTGYHAFGARFIECQAIFLKHLLDHGVHPKFWS